MRFIILIFTVFSTWSSADQSTLQQSGFMRAFHACVSNYSGEELNDETPGKTDSGLMNGEFINGDIDNGFYTYMNCITPLAVSVDHIGLSVNTWCANTQFTVNAIGAGFTVQLPHKRDGDSVRLRGMDFSCGSGVWSFTQSFDNNGIKDGCQNESLTIGNCIYDLTASSHANVSKAFNSRNGFEGQYTSYCSDGNWEEISQNCQATSCQTGQLVSWFSINAGEVDMCQGQVDALGSAEAGSNQVREFYSNLEQARAQSTVMTGTAEFTCRNSQWQRNTPTGSCREKDSSEKSCTISDDNNVFCH